MYHFFFELVEADVTISFFHVLHDRNCEITVYTPSVVLYINLESLVRFAPRNCHLQQVGEYYIVMHLHLLENRNFLQ